MLLLTILALKKIIGTFVYTTDVDHQPHVSHPIKSFATPSSSPQALHPQSSSSLSVFQSLCSTSYYYSVVDSSGGNCQFLFPPRVQIPSPLFLILPLVLTPLPHLFCFFFAAFLCSHSSFLFCLASSACLFSSYIWTCSSLFNRHDFVTTRGGFCFGWFISGMTKELYKLAGMIPVATSGLLCFGDVWSSSGTESCWLEEVAADCW